MQLLGLHLLRERQQAPETLAEEETDQRVCGTLTGAQCLTLRKC
jgi:hypothetical protein